VIKSSKVYFNEKQISLYEELKSSNFITEEFNDFVKKCFHKEIDFLLEKKLSREREQKNLS